MDRGKKRMAAWVAVVQVAGVICVLAQAQAQRTEEAVLGVQAVTEPLPWFDSGKNHAAYSAEIRDLRPNTVAAVTSLGRPPMSAPLSIRLSRFRYPATDGHLDALVRFDLGLDQVPPGRLLLALVDENDSVLSRVVIAPIPGAQIHFSYRFPAAMAGRSGELRAVWERPGEPATAAASFEIAPAGTVETSGRVRLHIPNTSQAAMAALPMTVGVPFPRGALNSSADLRLADARGNEIPVQVTETARWSRFGGVKWVRCDFTLDLEGQAKTVYLEYGPGVSRMTRPALLAPPAEDVFPTLRAGAVRLGPEGIAYDPEGQGNFRTVLQGAALAGAFVEQARGANYTGWGHRFMTSLGNVFSMPEAPTVELEENGPEKVVLRCRGWYAEPETGNRFCQYVVRYVVHRDSPVIRIFHTWIYTGDGNRDTIRNMGWRFPLNDMQPLGFLADFTETPEWIRGYYLRQHDADEYAICDYDAPGQGRRTPPGAIPAKPLKERSLGTRCPGVMAAQGQGVRLYIGVQDFWRNFPCSLMVEDDALTFYQWPRYGHVRRHPVHAGDVGNVWRLWFAHEGETLNFRIPAALTEAPLYVLESGPEPHFAHGQADSVNAQGVAKTAEMWLCLTSAEVDSAEAVRVLRGLHEETLRPVVDPAWLAASGAFYEITAAEPEKYPEFEQAYLDSVYSPLCQVERLGIYGKWIYGDLLREADLDQRTAGLYRTFRKAHWGWPYSWIPFARTGAAELMRFAQAATRMMTDVAFCHYVSPDLEQYFATELEPRQMWAPLQPFRRIGWHNRNLLPWAGYWGPTTRCYVDQADYLWNAWYMSGYHRAKDVALAWAEQTKIEEADKIMRGPITVAANRLRWPSNLQKQYTEMYEATWDPWFLAAAQALADMHLWLFRENGWAGHFWNAGYQTWQRYSGSPEHKQFALANAEHWSDWQQQGWANIPTTTIPATAFGYYLTGEQRFLQRLAGIADLARWAVYNADAPEYYRGWYVVGTSSAHMLWTSWMQTWFPMILGAFERAGGMPENFHPMAFTQALAPTARILVRKEANRPLALRLPGSYRIVGPEGRSREGDDGPEVSLEAEAPAGVYRISLPGAGRSVRLPVSLPGTPEVLLLDSEQTVGVGQTFAQHWFMVPPDAESFWIEFDNPAFFRQSMRQVIVWTPDAQEAWAHRERAVDHNPATATIRAEIQVRPGQAGRLWRVTLPGQRSMPFRLSPNLPQVLAHDPQRWFDPGSVTQP